MRATLKFEARRYRTSSPAAGRAVSHGLGVREVQHGLRTLEPERSVALRAMTSTKHPAGGFTLIELMVVVAVVALLAFIAIPAYERTITRGKLLAAQSALMEAGIDIEQYGQDHSTYVGGCPPSASAEDFTFTCPQASSTTYEILASGTGPLAGFEFTLYANGNKSTPSAPAGWSTSATCWVADPQGDCVTG